MEQRGAIHAAVAGISAALVEVHCKAKTVQVCLWVVYKALTRSVAAMALAVAAALTVAVPLAFTILFPLALTTLALTALALPGLTVALSPVAVAVPAARLFRRRRRRWRRGARGRLLQLLLLRTFGFQRPCQRSAVLDHTGVGRGRRHRAIARKRSK